MELGLYRSYHLLPVPKSFIPTQVYLFKSHLMTPGVPMQTHTHRECTYLGRHITQGSCEKEISAPPQDLFLPAHSSMQDSRKEVMWHEPRKVKKPEIVPSRGPLY